MYSNFLSYCDSIGVQVMSRKMFSILLREYLKKSIIDGSVQVKPSVNNTYKGIGPRRAWELYLIFKGIN